MVMARLAFNLGGTLAVVVSFGLTMAFITRPLAEINILAGFTLIATSSAGILAVVGRRELRWGIVALVLLILGLLPVIRWISLLYWPSVLLMSAGVFFHIIFSRSKEDP